MHFVKVALPRASILGRAKPFVCVWLVLVRLQRDMRGNNINNNRLQIFSHYVIRRANSIFLKKFFLSHSRNLIVA